MTERNTADLLFDQQPLDRAPPETDLLGSEHSGLEGKAAASEGPQPAHSGSHLKGNPVFGFLVQSIPTKEEAAGQLKDFRGESRL